MNAHNEKIPDPKELEKEIGDFLSKKFGDNVRIVSPLAMPREAGLESAQEFIKAKKSIDFNLKPEDLIAYLDQFIVKQDQAKAILSTKICTHFNRVKHAETNPEHVNPLVGSIKNNVLMLGPTGVGKTYMIRLIAKKIGVPFVKGDATKFSETGYVGGDVEDLVRDLVREANDDINLAQYGIIYIDEIDKIASSPNFIGADVSRTGVQRALLKPMEETEIDLKVPHDPISMMQEIEQFRKTGKREKRTVNTRNILFIMSGAFNSLAAIIKRRILDQGIGFGSRLSGSQEAADMLPHLGSEDLIEFGFETEFVGRLPVRAIFEQLTEIDLYDILNNPNNPIILGKKLDFAAYGIQIKFEDTALKILAGQAFQEHTGARGIVSAVEQALLLFETKLPSSAIKQFPVTRAVIEDPERSLASLLSSKERGSWEKAFEKLAKAERARITRYVNANQKRLADKYSLTLTPSRVDVVATFYGKYMMDIDHIIRKIKSYCDEVKKMELYFFKNHDINLVLEDDAIDFIIERLVTEEIDLDRFFNKLSEEFSDGLKLIREKTGRNRFFINGQALSDPESFLNNLIKNELNLS